MTFGNPLQWKYASYFSLLVALFLAASGAIAGWLSYRGTLDAFEELQRERAVRASQQIARFFDAVGWAVVPGQGPLDHGTGDLRGRWRIVDESGDPLGNTNRLAARRAAPTKATAAGNAVRNACVGLNQRRGKAE